MIIDTPRPEDLPGLRRIWQEAFGDDDAFLDGFFRTGFSPRRCRCLRLQDRLAAVLYWFDCSAGGNKLAYLYAIATDKSFRGRGLCRNLMADTHQHLKTLGYTGAVLVPGSQELFCLYEKMGYTPFCPLQPVWIEAGKESHPVSPIGPETFDALRLGLLPAEGIVQDGDTTAYLAAFTRFYRTASSVMCLSGEGETLYFQEYLGNPELLPGIIAGLGAKKALVRVPGGKPYAMFHSLDHTKSPPAYLGIPLD